MDDVAQLQSLQKAQLRIKTELAKVLVGQEDVVDQLLICLFADAHAVIEGVPGLAKTLMIATLSRIVDLSYNRIQFTPDLLPSDVTGSEILEEDRSTGHRGFRFVKGPVFSNIVLADEINRTPPKTQSALLQCMQEYKVTVAGNTFDLPRPFFVLATQNPIEQEGTYPLPEAQLDRFMFLIKIDYPTEEEEREMVLQTTRDASPAVEKVIDGECIREFQKLVQRIPVAQPVIRFAVHLTKKTRPSESVAPEYVRQWLTWGAGPRASQHLILAAKSRAALLNRPAPDMEDLRAVAKPILRHRLILSFNAEAEGIRPDDVVDRLLKE